MKKLWDILYEIGKGIKIWLMDIPCIVRWCKIDFKKRSDNGSTNNK